MPEHDALVDAYQHLEQLPRAADALHTLRKIASLVKPIMRKRRWRVGTLKEFFPKQSNLLGLNINHGSSICLRLRHAGDNRQFLPLENVVDTMLHELSHNIHGPHNDQFQALWNELRDEYMDLKLKGYSGEGFLSTGHLLGGRGVPVTELRRKARAQAEKRRAMAGLTQGSGQKLGGRPVLRGVDMRNVIADAVTGRNNITQGCASGTTQADEVSREADRNGFRTKAEEDDANDRAIAQALWELIQEEEARNAGLEPPDRTNNPSHPLDPKNPVKPVPPRNQSPAASKPVRSNPYPHRPQSRLIRQDDQRRKKAGPTRLISEDEEQRRKAAATATTSSKPRSPTPEAPSEWSCEVCTLINPIAYLACDACGSERPNTVSVVATPPPPDSPASSLGWNCHNCGTFMEHHWWVCSMCGVMKASSSVSA